MTSSGNHSFQVDHLSHFRYSAPAHHSVMLLRLHPREDGGQKMLNFSLKTDPAAALATLEDALGNTCHLLNLHRQHRHTIIESRVQVTTRSSPPPGRRTQPDNWHDFTKMVDRARFWEFLNPSRFIYSCPPLSAFMQTHGLQRGDNPLSALLDTASALYRTFRYVPGSTDAHSPIEHILKSGRGVCQDYTHVLIAIARNWGIPARYVSGYLYLEGAAGEQTPAGESHSWGEFFFPGSGWIGIDPTNNSLADHRHIRIAVGRDYADAAPTTGTLSCNGQLSLGVQVTVKAIDEATPVIKPHFVPANLIVVTGSPPKRGHDPDQ